MPNINLMNNTTTFALTEVNSTTVGALRAEKNLGDAVINVDRTVAGDDHILESRPEGEEMNVAVVNKDKRGGKPATIARRYKNKRVDLMTRNHILLDIESGMSIAKAAKAYNIPYGTVYNWVSKGLKGHAKVRSNNTANNKVLSSTRVTKDGGLTILSAETKNTSRSDFQPRVKEVTLHLSGTYVPEKGQLRITRELLNYLNEVGAHLTK
jgi:transposase-like protein